MYKAKNKLRSILILIIILSVVFIHPAVTTTVNASNSDSQDIEYLKSVMDMIKEKHKGEVTDEQLIEGALKGMFDTMDPYTTYFTPEEAEDFLGGMKATYEGIGILMMKSDKGFVITKVFALSPAEKAGILQGDIIVSINGKSVVGVSADETSSLLLGEKGTQVNVGIIRNGSHEVMNFELTRDVIKVSPVNYEIKGDIGYIKLEVFNSNANEFFSKALKEIDEKGIQKIILDLRNNTGGDVEQAVKIARNFVPKGLITKLDFQSQPDKEYYSYLKNPKYQIAVLVNEMTASASEILAGAVQDTQSGTLIGTKTFGKAKVQQVIPILSPEAHKKYKKKLGKDIVDAYELITKYKINPYKSEIIGWSKITTGMYTTPKGRIIDNEGLEPDIYVDNPKVTDGILVTDIYKLTKTAKYALNDEGTDIYYAKKILKLLGYDIEIQTMKMDEKTCNAVSKFREDNGLYPGGVLDFTTQDALNSKLDEIILKYDMQYVKAVEVLNK